MLKLKEAIKDLISIFNVHSVQLLYVRKYTKKKNIWK